MKAGSQNTKQAVIRMLLWQDIAVLRGTAVLLLRLTGVIFSLIINISAICSPAYLKRQFEIKVDPKQVCSISY